MMSSSYATNPNDPSNALPPITIAGQPFDPNGNIDITRLPDLLTIKEAAELLRVSTLTIKRWGKRGKLEAIRINSRGDRRFRKESILYLLGIDPEDMKRPEDEDNSPSQAV